MRTSLPGESSRVGDGFVSKLRRDRHEIGTIT
jgi:hypothetical protein